MSLIEDAHRLAARGFTPWEDSCHFTCELCGKDGAGEGDPFPHAPDCPWLSLPRIVTVLEAAERLRSAEHAIKDRTRERLLSNGPLVQYLGPDGDPLYAELHAAKEALYAAMAGEVVPSVTA